MTTSDSTPSARMTDVEVQLIRQATQDKAFRNRLLTDPKSVLKEQGLALSDDVQIQVLQETSNQYYLILPASNVSSSESILLSDQELEGVAGGGATSPAWTGCNCIISATQGKLTC